MQLGGGCGLTVGKKEAEDVNKERLASDKEDVAAFVSLLSSGWTTGSCDQAYVHAHFSRSFSPICEINTCIIDLTTRKLSGKSNRNVGKNNMPVCEIEHIPLPHSKRV